MRSYDKDFKINTVNLYTSSRHFMNTIAQEPGIPTTTFSRWIRDYRREGNGSFPGKGQIKGSEEDLRSLRKELAYVILGAVGLHIAAALYHQFYLKNNLLRRMITGKPL